MKNSNANGKESLISRMDQAEYRLSGPKDKVEDLDQINKKYEKHFKTQERNVQETWDTMKSPSL